jgi:hypothetical protein
MKQAPEFLRFRGAPARLLATVDYAEQVPPASACRVKLPNNGSLPLSVRRLGSKEPAVSVMSFRLPQSTPPGTYKGSVALGERQIPIEVEVEPRTSLRFIRAEFVHTVKPGGKVSTELVLMNRGNVDVEIPREDKFCVFDDSGIARALYQGLVEEDGAGEHRINRIMDELAKAHGGLVRVTVTEGSGRLAPEEVRELTVEFLFSRRLIGGHTYRGTWPVSEASLDVKVEVRGESEGKEKGR